LSIEGAAEVAAGERRDHPDQKQVPEDAYRRRNDFAVTGCVYLLRGTEKNSESWRLRQGEVQGWPCAGLRWAFIFQARRTRMHLNISFDTD